MSYHYEHSFLYKHRDQMDGLWPLVEVAHWAVYSHVPWEDQEDVEQDIIICLMQVVEKYGIKDKAYLRVCARNRRSQYFRNKYKERMLFSIEAISERGMEEDSLVVSHDYDLEARLDAEATLAALPERLIQIGYKVLDGENLSDTDLHYKRKQKAKLLPKLNCRKYASLLSDWEERRILQLHREGMSLKSIQRTMGRSGKPIKRVLAKAGFQLHSSQSWLAKMVMEAKDRNKRIRHAYFVDGKSIKQIAREFHHCRRTVRWAINHGNDTGAAARAAAAAGK